NDGGHYGAVHDEVHLGRAEVDVRLFLDDLDGEPAENRAHHRPAPPEERSEHDQHAVLDVEHAAVVDERDVVRVDSAGDPDQHRARHEGQYLVDGRVDADGRGFVLVVADGDQPHAELGAAD